LPIHPLPWWAPRSACNWSGHPCVHFNHISRCSKAHAQSQTRIGSGNREEWTPPCNLAGWVRGYTTDYFVWLDESSVDDHTNQRTQGWAALGRACVRRATFIRGQRYSILPALTSDGIVALDIFEGSVNKEKFIRFLKEDLVYTYCLFFYHFWFSALGPATLSLSWPTKCCCVGQLRHSSWRRSLWAHCGQVRLVTCDVLSEFILLTMPAGAKLIYLPPYSPDFNPIEQTFHSIKAWLWRHEAEAIRPEVRPWLIHQAVASVSAESAEGWILNCGYSFE